jgi:hypothetical protein
MNYVSTFIEVAPDSKAGAGTAPPARGEKPTVAQLEYALINVRPYQLTQEDVLFAVHVERTGIDARRLAATRDKLWSEFFAKPMACMRASPLPKSYGWGLHFDAKGRVALVGVETKQYARLAKDPSVKHLVAMRSKRA